MKRLLSLFSPREQSSRTPSSSNNPVPTVEYHWLCNKCFCTIKSGEIRYKSFQFKNYELCEKCFLEQKQKESSGTTMEEDTILIESGMFLPETEHKHDIKKRVNASRSNQTLSNAFREYSQRPCFGILNQNEMIYEWITYREVHSRVLHFSAGLVAADLIDHTRGKPVTSDKRQYIGICARNCLEWFITDYACIHKSIISIPIHFTMTAQDCRHIVTTANVSVVVCSSDLTTQFLSIGEQYPMLKAVIEIDSTQRYRTVQVGAGTPNEREITIYSFQYIEELGVNQSDLSYLVPLSSENEVLTVIYTSGSTGKPKGAMIPDSAWNFNLHGMIRSDPEIVFSFSPLAHMSDRKHVCINVCNGSRIAIFQRDLSEIFVDIKLVRPTILVSTPRLWNIIYGEYQKQLREKADSIDPQSNEYQAMESQLLEEFKGILGDRINTLVTGGAATSPTVLNFLNRCFRGCVINNGYGATEVGGIMSGNRLKKGVQFKLVDVPEMNYLITDKPYPRGELCVKTEEMFLGYLNSEQPSTFDQDGFHHTGDIVVHKGRDHIEIIDRLKNIFKLAQGEFVAPEHVENTYLKSPYIDQIYIYGNSLKSYVVAVIVPRKEVLLRWAIDMNMSVEGATENEKITWLGTDARVKELYFSEFVRIASEEQLQSYEIPRGFILEPEPFTCENSKMTALLKIARINCEMFYKERLERLYEELQEIETGKINNQLTQLLHRVTGEECQEIQQGFSSSTPTSLGIDSLHAVKFASIIKNTYNVEVPLKMLMSQATLSDISSFIAGKGKRCLSQETNDINWQQEASLDDNIVVGSLATTISDFSLHDKHNIFLTGATGFLGVFLLHELLCETSCTIFCLIRIQNGECQVSREMKAMERIVSQMQRASLWQEQFRQRICPIVGDMSKRMFGISEQSYYDLAERIDVIYHNGALVNSILPYTELKPINVQATEEVLRFAVVEKLKIVHYISTIGVVQGVAATKVISDQQSFSDLESEQQLYTRLNRVSGYSSSKWVAESLCHEARKRGIPITIHRPGMIGPDTRSGMCNLTDWVMRLIRGCIALKYYPITGPSRTLDLTPVDIASRVIVKTSQASKTVQDSVYVYHIVNSDCAIPFDEIFNCVKEVNHEMKSCETFDQWKHILELRLEQSGEEEELLWPLRALFRGGFPSNGGTFSNENTIRVLRELSKSDSNAFLPYKITKDYIVQFSRWIQQEENHKEAP